MALNFVILSLSDLDVDSEEVCHLVNGINFMGGEVIQTIILTCIQNKSEIEANLIEACNSNNNVIIVIGNTDVYETHKVAHEAIREVMDKNISNKLNEMTWNLGEKLKNTFEKLKNTFDGAICGIRNQTLMINMCGTDLLSVICLKTYADTILQIIHSIAEEQAISNNDENDNSGTAFSSYYFSDEGQARISMIKEMHKKRQRTNIMDSIEKATEIIKEEVLSGRRGSTYSYSINTENALGRILAEDIYSSRNVPSYKSSTKHGYAVLASDRQGVRRVLPVQSSRFHAQTKLVSGTCMRVRSGAPIPNGATAVVTLDNTKIIGSDDENNHNKYFNSDDEEYKINVLIAPAKNDNIRNAGDEIDDGELILSRYSRLGPTELGTLTLCDINVVEVIDLPLVGILSIGDFEYDLESKRIYDSSKIILMSLLKENGLDPVDFGTSTYQLNNIIQKMQNVLEEMDVLVTTGHANDNDILKPILREYFNATIHFGGVNIKPGKSTTFATCMINKKKKYVLCMSTKPTTVSVVAYILLLPLLNNLQLVFLSPINVYACLNVQHKLHPRPKFVWATVYSDGTFLRANALQNQEKGLLKYSTANALLMLPPRSVQVQTISKAFVQAMLLASQSPKNM